MSLDKLRASIREFSKERDWEQFHNPKNLAIALSVEASELLEVFQWLTPEQSANLKADARAAVKDEIGDVMICLVNLADRLNVDLLASAEEKLEKVKAKYPVEKARGLAKKYSEFGED